MCSWPSGLSSTCVHLGLQMRKQPPSRALLKDRRVECWESHTGSQSFYPETAPTALAHTSLDKARLLAMPDSKRTVTCCVTTFPEDELGIFDKVESDYIRPSSVLQLFGSLSFSHSEICPFPPHRRQFKIQIQL